MEKPKYSICITQFNNGATVKQSLESILNQIDDDFEVVVVDNKSTDGSYEILKKFEGIGKIKLVQIKCSRGKGREIAFENSRGKYIIANMDMDDVFKPRLRELLARYHAVAEGKLLWSFSKMKGGYWGGESFTVAPRHLIKELGGWRDLQIFEDLELCTRAARQGKFSRGGFALLDVTNAHPERTKTKLGRIRWRYIWNRESLRTGLHQRWREHPKWKRKVFNAAMRVFVLPFYDSYVDPFNYDFTEENPIYSVGLEEPRQKPDHVSDDNKVG